MLSYLNSHLITFLVRGVLIRSNMVTSGYISQLPVISFSDNEKAELSVIAKNVIDAALNTKIAITTMDDAVNF